MIPSFLKSTNSTWGNGQRVQRHVLNPGVEIQIGYTRLRFSPHANAQSDYIEEVLS
jgi:pSer/pThr/pTyr-binding forkhead associated (FHA) protein